MKKFSYVIIFFLALSCGQRKRDLQDASKALCNCFSSYDLNSGVSLNNVLKCNDSIIASEILEDIPQEKLFKQLQADCPKTYKILKSNLVISD